MPANNNKDPKKNPGPPPDKYYDVYMEVEIPALLHWKVLAKNEEEAFQMVRRMKPHSIKYRFEKQINRLAKVYDAGTLILRFLKRF